MTEPEIVAHARAGRWYAVIDTLLEMWRVAPNRELADLVDEVSVHAGTAASWDNLDDPPAALAIDRLLAQLLDKGINQAWARVEVIAGWPRDPRIDRWVAAQFASPPSTNTGTWTFWQRMVPLANRIADAQAASLLARAAPVNQAPAPKLGNIRDVPFAAGTREIIDDLRAALRAASAAAIPERHGAALALFDAVIANPDDDATRIVLGDVLLEQGDPRGELIALQLRPAPTGAEQARIKDIIRRHAPHLLGALAPVLREYAFEGGFLARATVKSGTVPALVQAIARTVGDPLWATVVHLEGGTEQLVMHPILRSLRSLTSCKAGLGALARLPRLERLVTSVDDKDWLVVANDPAAFVALRALAIHPHPVTARSLFTLRLLRRLETLDVRLTLDNWPGPNLDIAFALLRSAARLGPREVTIRFVRNRHRDWHSAFVFANGEVTITRSENMNPGAEQLVTNDIERGLATLSAT